LGKNKKAMSVCIDNLNKIHNLFVKKLALTATHCLLSEAREKKIISENCMEQKKLIELISSDNELSAVIEKLRQWISAFDNQLFFENLEFIRKSTTAKQLDLLDPKVKRLRYLDQNFSFLHQGYCDGGIRYWDTLPLLKQAKNNQTFNTNQDLNEIALNKEIFQLQSTMESFFPRLDRNLKVEISLSRSLAKFTENLAENLNQMIDFMVPQQNLWVHGGSTNPPKLVI